MTGSPAEVVIVGAGPAGASAAYYLATLGRSVLLLDRSRFPRDKSCGDAVTHLGVGVLAEMGVLPLLGDAWRTHGLKVSMRGHRTRTFNSGAQPGETGLVVPRAILDAAIVARAVAAGARLREGIRVRRLLRDDTGLCTGVETDAGERLAAPVVVAADGATSVLARQAGLCGTAPGGLGYALRAYFSDVADLEDHLEFFAPLASASRRWLPSYGWIFPVGSGVVNVGVGVSAKQEHAGIRELFGDFVNRIRRDDVRFSHARQAGRLLGAPLRFDFDPRRSWAPGLVVVGDAAGMISPFTGEGIAYALEAGRIAADVIDRQLRAGSVHDLSGYAARVARRYGGYFETGRHAVSRHRLVWHVLDDTFDDERPLFALTRTAALAPEGLGGRGGNAILRDVTPCIERALLAAPRLAEIDEILADTVRTEWPFLVRMPGLGADGFGVALRPALLVLLAATFGAADRDRQVTVAAAVELAGFAALAQLSVGDAKPAETSSPERANWGTMFAVLTADVLLARALTLVTRHSGLPVPLAQAIERLCAGRAAELRATVASAAEHLAVSERTGPAALLATACELGARVAGAPEAAVTAVTRYGRALGLALQLDDDIARLSGGTDRLGRTAAADLSPAPVPYPLRVAIECGDLDTAELTALRDGPGDEHERAAALVRRIGGGKCLPLAAGTAERLAGEARAALAGLPDGPARRSLDAIPQHVLAPAAAEAGPARHETA